jgi:RimJ/RimL family protein N-acetyltransferase
MKLKPLTLSDCEQVRQWRNENLSMLRTSFPLTEEMQGEFYLSNVCNRSLNARYWAIVIEEEYPSYGVTKNITMKKDGIREVLIGMAGIENIEWENRLAEIGLIMNPDYIHMAEDAIELILEQAFNYLNLENVFGEVYKCSPYSDIWYGMALENKGTCCVLPNRKYWQGKYYDALFFNINRWEWKKCHE